MPFAARKRALNKARANRQYDRRYGGQDLSAQNAASGTASPRAAVYSGHMGVRQRRASKIHETLGTPVANKSTRLQSNQNMQGTAVATHASKLYKRLANVIATFVCFAFVVGFLYGPAAQCYCQMRERDRLNAEYSAVQAHTDSLQSSVDSLQTTTGIEDAATSQFGMVKEGEQAVSVTGLSSAENSNSEFTSNIVPGSIPAPDTWYSGLLDSVFGYEQ